MTVIDLSKRNTASKKIPEIDSLYVYATAHIIKFTHRNQSGEGYRFKNHKAIQKAADGEIHIYHRTAVINGVKKGLTLVTKNSKVRDVQKFFNEQIKVIEADDALFKKFCVAKESPVELGIYYTY